MAKKQTRRSISVSRNTYERLKAYCETNQISMSQFVERRVGDFLGATTGLSEVVIRPAIVSSAPTAPVARTAPSVTPSATPTATPIATPTVAPRLAQPVREADVDSQTRQAADSIFTF